MLLLTNDLKISCISSIIFVRAINAMKIEEEIKTSGFDSVYSKAMINLFYTSNWFRDLHKSIFKKYQLLPQHYNVLRIVNGRYPDPVSPSEIKQVMLDKGPDVTRLVDKLVKMNLADRCQNEENRRVIEIRISDRGRALLPKMTNEIRTMVHEHFGLTDKEAHDLSDLLDKMRES